MSSNIRSAAFFWKMKSQFPRLSGSEQEANADCHITSGCWFICWRKRKSKRERHRRSDRHIGGESVTNLRRFFPLHHNEVGTESLCIRLINSYSSSAWHPGNRSGFALGLIFRPVEDSQSIRAQTAYSKLSDRPKKRGDEREKSEGD